MLWEPRVIESGRGMVELEGFKEDEKEKRRASVLSSFSLSWFSVIHVFMSSVRALSSLVRLVTSLRGADFWSCVSSAKSWWFKEWLAMISERGVVYRTKRMGPVMSPEAHCTWGSWWAVMMTKTSYWLNKRRRMQSYAICWCHNYYYHIWKLVPAHRTGIWKGSLTKGFCFDFDGERRKNVWWSL